MQKADILFCDCANMAMLACNTVEIQRHSEIMSVVLFYFIFFISSLQSSEETQGELHIMNEYNQQNGTLGFLKSGIMRKNRITLYINMKH